MSATITNSSIAATLTQANIYAGIKSAFSALGYSPYAEYTSSGTNFVVYTKVFNASKTYAKIFFRIGVTTAFAISQAIGSDFDTGTNTLANASVTTTSSALTTSTPVDLRAFKSSSGEYDLLHVRQGSTAFIMLGWLRPATLNSIDEIAYTAALMFNNITSNCQLTGTALNPYGNASYYSLVHAYFCSANHYGLRDLIPNLVIISASAKGIFGLTSDDFAIGAGNGLSILESVGNRQMIVNRANSESSIFLG